MLPENLFLHYNSSLNLTEDERNLYIGLAYFIQVYFIFIVFMLTIIINDIVTESRLSDRRHYYVLI